jgi:hypothetical protein
MYCKDAFGYPIRRWKCWCLRATPWPLLVLALVIMFGYFWVYRSPTVAMVGLAYYYDFCLASSLFGLLAAGRCVQQFVRNSCEVWFGVQTNAFRSRRWFWPWLIVIVAWTHFMLWAQVPMKVAFLLSRPWLDGMADEALADRANAHILADRWAGLYRIMGVEVIGNTVVLYLGENKGSYGFARVPGATDDVIYNTSHKKDGPQNHLDFPSQDGHSDPMGRRISDDWFVMYSFYWLVKIGWS